LVYLARDYGYLPEDLAELFLLTEGNVDNVDDKDIDFFVVNPCVLVEFVCLCRFRGCGGGYLTFLCTSIVMRTCIDFL